MFQQNNTQQKLVKQKIINKGSDITIVSYSYSLLEVIESAKILKTVGIISEVIDLRSLRPMDYETICLSVEKTGRLLVVDNGWSEFGISAEIVSHVIENKFNYLKAAPKGLEP